MDANEAIKKIDEINKVMESSNRALFSGEKMMAIGGMITLIPIIEIGTKGMTFGNEALADNPMLLTIIHTVFYWALFSLLGRAIPSWRSDRESLHPLIKKAFGIHRQFLVTIMGSIFAFAAIGQFQFIHPIVFLLLGFLFSLYGKYSIPAVTCISWTYTVAGVLYLYLTKFHIPHLWVWFTLYNGLSYVLMGLFLCKASHASLKLTV